MKIVSQNSILFTKPLRKLPKQIIYKAYKPIIDIEDDSVFPRLIPGFSYKMADTKTGQVLGEMIAAPVVKYNRKNEFYPEELPYVSFFIHLIKTFSQGEGFGTKLIELAKRESVNYGCEGRVHLISSRIFDRNNPPHIFYKKNGFISNSQEMNDYLDNCIKSGTKLDVYSDKADNLNMYLPVNCL